MYPLPLLSVALLYDLVNMGMPRVLTSSAYVASRRASLLFLDKGILNNIPVSISKSYIWLLLQTLKAKQKANYKPQSLLLNCHLFRAKMSIAVTSKARHAFAIKPLSFTFCKIAHVLVR